MTTSCCTLLSQTISCIKPVFAATTLLTQENQLESNSMKSQWGCEKSTQNDQACALGGGNLIDF